MKISNASQSTTLRATAENHAPTPQGEPRTQSLGILSGLSARRTTDSSTKNSNPRIISKQTASESHSSKANATMGADRQPFHSGTANDCGLHTIAALTGWSEQQVCQALELKPEHIAWISENGMSPDLVTRAFQIINNGNAAHRQGSPNQMIADLKNFPDDHQFALGIQRGQGIGHLVSARRIGNQLQITDRQIGETYTMNSPEDLANYLHHNNAAVVHTWYNA